MTLLVGYGRNLLIIHLLACAFIFNYYFIIIYIYLFPANILKYFKGPGTVLRGLRKQR